MIKVLAVVALIAMAQIIPSCGGKGGPSGDEEVGAAAQVIGWVDEKRTRVWETDPYMIVINQLEYGVPYDFWKMVEVGDLVKFDGARWVIVRRARG